jgi:hypothetical protein
VRGLVVGSLKLLKQVGESASVQRCSKGKGMARGGERRNRNRRSHTRLKAPRTATTPYAAVPSPLLHTDSLHGI